jgi:hypothetical protein
MAIKKFVDFINEDVKIPVVDVLIDIDGNIYNGIKPEYPLRKGNISQKVVPNMILSKTKKDKEGNPLEVKSTKTIVDAIIGSDNKPYPLGVDKNGYLVYPSDSVDEDGYVVTKNGDRISINNKFGSLYADGFNGETEWRAYLPPAAANNKIDYSFLLPKNPTGWVNVKVDMEVLKRVRRYSLSLGDNNRGFNSFLSKLEDMEEISNRNPDDKKVRGATKKRDTIQKEMAVIILLHYINEIKDFFTPGSSGFLFESFLAGLIPNSKVIDDNGIADVVADGLQYQMKLYANTYKYIPVSMRTLNDYYVVCIKNPQDIEIFVIDNSERNEEFIETIHVESGFKLDTLKSLSNVANSRVTKYTLQLSRIEEKIESIAVGLKGSLDSLYAQLSEFQYNVETIITGVNNEGKLIDASEFNSISNSATNNVRNMRDQLDELISSVNKRDINKELRLKKGNL